LNVEWPHGTASLLDWLRRVGGGSPRLRELYAYIDMVGFVDS
jgi:hypothetical protein